MAIVTRYFDQFSHVELSGSLTAEEILQNVMKYNRETNFKNIKIRVVDSTNLEHVLFNDKQMKTFIAVDKGSFVNNDGLIVILVNNQTQFQPIFEAYVESMSVSPWQFHIVDSLQEAERVAMNSGVSLKPLFTDD